MRYGKRSSRQRPHDAAHSSRAPSGASAVPCHRPPVRHQPHWFNIVRSAVIGVFLGVVPGHGPTIASFIAYSEARRAAREPNEFGHGDVDGVLAPETAANAAANAAVFSSLVPALTPGIPGTADAAIVMAALTMHGMVPGPMLLARSGDILYTVFVGAFVANAMMLVVALLGARILASTTRAPLPVIAPIIVVFSLVGAYAVNRDVFDVFVALGVGLVGYGLRMVRIPLPPMVLGLILGAPIETYFLRARVLYDSVWDALTRPVCLVVLILTIAAVTFSLFKEFKARRSPRRIA